MRRCYTFTLLPLLLLGLLAGCTTPVGVTRISPETSYRQSTANPLNDGVLSTSTRVVLHRYNLDKTYADDPVKTIRFLQDTAIHDDRRDLVFALAEVSYLLGDQLRGSNSWDDQAHAPDAFLLSSAYAWFYLLGEGKEPPPSPYDYRFREACDLYNRALARAFPTDENGVITMANGKRMLTVGELNITVKADTLTWQMDQFEKFLPSDAFEVFGFSVRNRTPGLGMPLIGVTKRSPESPNGGALPVTAVLRIKGGIKEFGGGGDNASLELYSAYDDSSVKVDDRTVPLETDSTAPLAYRLNDAKVWSLGLKWFFAGETVTNPLLLIQPYEKGRIPVVFVHGTASSPVWWAEMLNSLRADPTIRKRFQFWFYQYNSSNLVAHSAAVLRETLTDMIKQIDPEGKDPALRQMVIIGHSQGGLLTKMAVVAPEDKLWKNISDANLDDLDLDADIRAQVKRMLFFKPLPFVKRVIFISTPHRGSFLTKDWVRALVRTLVSIPLDIVTLNPEKLAHVYDELMLPDSIKKLTTSIDSMSPENPNLKILTQLPLAPGVKGHSIIAVLPEMDIVTGNDGVVEYQSAHIDGVESEFIVRADHSCQGHPFTIEEVRRILMEHLGVEVIGPEITQSLQQTESTPVAASPSPPAPARPPAATPGPPAAN